MNRIQKIPVRSSQASKEGRYDQRWNKLERPAKALWAMPTFSLQLMQLQVFLQLWVSWFCFCTWLVTMIAPFSFERSSDSSFQIPIFWLLTSSTTPSHPLSFPPPTSGSSELSPPREANLLYKVPSGLYQYIFVSVHLTEVWIKCFRNRRRNDYLCLGKSKSAFNLNIAAEKRTYEKTYWRDNY